MCFLLRSGLALGLLNSWNKTKLVSAFQIRNLRHLPQSLSSSRTHFIKMSATNEAEAATEEFPQGLNGMDLIIDGWFHERGVLWPGQAMTLKVKNVLDHHRSDFQDVLVFESESHGNVLVLDGVIQVTERDEFAYQEMIAHIPLYAHKDPQKVLVIGGGDGGVLREIARHPGVQEIVICEIDGDVIDVSKKYLPTLAKGYDDPRVTVHVMDGAKFMDENKASFDVIITDSSDPVGPASVLFETPFYESMFHSLRDGGIVCTQGECMWLHLDLIRPLVRSISRIYQSVGYAYTTIPTYPSGQIGFILATKGRGSCEEPTRAPPTEVQRDLQYYTTELHKAAFVLPAFAKRTIMGM
jgi:spermidine synthase